MSNRKSRDSTAEAAPHKGDPSQKSSHTFMLVRLRKADNERGGKRKKRERTIRGKQKQKSHHPTQIPEKIPTPAISRGNKNARKENERNSNSAHCALDRALGPKSSNQALFFSSLPNLCRNSYKWTLHKAITDQA
jgi:hypothetical protein